MMQKTAADFIKLAQSHPFCAGFLVTALQRGLSEEEMQAGLLKVAAESPIREAAVDSFLQAAGVATHVKMAAGWGDKLKQMRNRASAMDPVSKSLLAGGTAGAATAVGTAAGLGGMAYMHRPDGPQPAGARQLAPPRDTPLVEPKLAEPKIPASIGGHSYGTLPAAPFRTTQSTAPLAEPKIPASIGGHSYGTTPEAPFRTTQSTTPLAEPKIPASIGGHSYGDRGTPPPAGPAWYTNPAVLGGGGLLALALLARNLGGDSRSKDEDDDEQDY